MDKQQPKTKFAKSLAKISALFGVCIFLAACQTVVPKTIEAQTASYSGGVRNSSIVKFIPGGAILDAHGRDRYNAMIADYGPLFAPALKTDDGIIPLADGTFQIDDQHLAQAVQMNLWRRSGQAPIKPSMVDKVINALK